MSNITLSAGVRQNLLSLQNTASLLSTTQGRLATGKKVNSALDNPSNFFTSSALSDRASDLNSLLDSIGQAQQTVNQAETGITSLTALVQSAKSLATQAQQSAVGTVNYTAITGGVSIAADTTRVTSTSTVASAVGGVTASVQSSATLEQFHAKHVSILADQNGQPPRGVHPAGAVMRCCFAFGKRTQVRKKRRRTSL